MLSGAVRWLCRSGSMDRAVVRVLPSEPRLTISLVLSGTLRQLQRDPAEPLGRSLSRIAASAAKGPSKKRKGRAAEPVAGPRVRLWFGGEPVSEDELSGSAWRDGAVLEVGESRYRVERNPPACTELRLPGHIMAGFPVCPRLELDFSRPELCRFTWYRAALPAAGCPESEAGRGGAGAGEQRKESPGEAQAGDCPAGEAGAEWEEAGEQLVYTPGVSEVGCRLKLRVTPGDGARFGPAREVEAPGPVAAGPGRCVFEERQLYTGRLSAEPVTRTVSYNVLAAVYAESEHARTALFPYCAPYALQRDYRLCLLQRELTGYRADLLCLQEVDRDGFTDSLRPAMDAFGLSGVYKGKDRQLEGLATFYRRSRFTLLSQHDIQLGAALQGEPLHRDIMEKLERYPGARDRVLNRSSALQVSVLQSTSDPSRKICVANTHLYFHPKGGNIRLVQIGVALTHIRHIAYELYPGIPVIFCGDFNSTPSTGMYSFITNGTISEDHEDWTSNGEDERCNMSFTHPFKLKSACGEPAYTNYVGGFHGCLDYIFIDSERIEVEQIIPLPSHEEVTSHQALPSVSHPSDHIALICDLKW
ncbi:2',5'-phosphodiesterase 12 [Pelobates fuscus]|uniref:2',5'-phosphodiesterase 12 n=1 Tax=Pelobates fuscus TaxID=191477 RepID=UPI002FE4560D